MSLEMEKMDKEHLLHKYLNGTATPEEIITLEVDPTYSSYIKIANTAESFETPMFREEDNFNAIASKLADPSKVRPIRSLKVIYRVAAAVIILFVGYLFISGNETTISTQIAEKKEFMLPDASQVHLNSQSQISFDGNKWNQKRSLKLEGEAFFKVHKGKLFIVNTSQGFVQVLGTRFNVFSRDSLFSIKCYEGLVSVSYSDTTVQVPAGTMIEIRNQNRIEKSKIATASPNWIANESTFQNVSLSLVLEELKRQYPINLISQNIVDKNFTGSFTHKDLNVALRSICDPLQLEFTIQGEDVRLYAKKNN